MKFISNILMLAVLVFNNLSVLPLAFPARQSTLALSSTPTETPTPTETALPPIETPAPTETTLPPTETPTPIEPASTPVFGDTPTASPTNTTTSTQATKLATGSSDFSVAFSASMDHAKIGDLVPFTLIITNRGKATYTDLRFSNVLPKEFDYRSSKDQGFVFDEKTRELPCLTRPA